MSHPCRISLRAPPHLPFIQGFPGVPGGKDRKQAAVCGTVEVRVGAQPIKAKWVRVEIRRHESLPPGFPTQDDTWEHVGEINTLWQSVGKEFDTLQTADFKFFLPLPETLPPTVEMAKGTGVWYELVAALSYKKKGGIFKSDTANILKISEPLRITKHELHAVWPVYNNPDSKTVAGQNLTMTIQRPGVAFGPGDRILLTASLRSARALPFKLRGFECTLLEVVSSIPQAAPATKEAKRKSKPPQQPVVKSRPIAQARCAVDENMGKGGEKTARIDMAVPPDVLVTVRNAKTLEVGYEIQVKAVCDGFEGPVVPGIKYVVGQYTRSLAQQAMVDIGHVDSLCGGPRATRPVSPPTFALSTPPISTNHSPSPQGFVVDPRRISTSTVTTATTMDQYAADFGPSAISNRPYSTVPARQSLAFPTPHPAPNSGRQSPSATTISDLSQSQFDDRTPDLTQTNRYSSATMGTFGTPTLRPPNIPSAPPTPDLTLVRPTWDSAEREKASLYNTARQNAASTQRSGGVPLDELGLADIPDVDVAPPEYAPPVPVLPSGKYRAPVRPVSTYASPDPSFIGADSPDIASANSHSPFDAMPNGGSGRTGIDGDRGLSNAGAELPNSISQASAGPSSVIAAVGGISEKEQMRRYYEAKDKVENRGEGSSSASSAPAQTSSPAPMVSEKEQMRRYYAAKDRVVSNGNNSINGEASTSTPPPNTYTGPLSSSTSALGSSAAPILSEKEQMRRYYEARDRVEATQNGAASSSNQTYSSLSNGTVATSGSGSGSAFASGSGSGSGPQHYPSATDEKDAMRRRYEEATSRVSRSGTASPPPMDSPLTYSTPNIPHQSLNQLSSQPGSSSTSGFSSQSPSYPSANDEKERMRRLYDEANQRVSRAQASSSLSHSSETPPPRVDSPSIPPSLMPNQSSSTKPPPIPTNPFRQSSAYPSSSTAEPSMSSMYPSAEQEKESMRARYADATSAVSRARVVSDGEGQAYSGGRGSREGSAGLSEGNGGGQPPPPLPSRPPADYINLLSPTGGSMPQGYR